MKMCRKCKELKPLTMYSPRKDTKDGLHIYCKECIAKYRRQRHSSDAAVRSRSYQATKKCNEKRMNTDTNYRTRQRSYIKARCKLKYATVPSYRESIIKSARINMLKRIYSLTQAEYLDMLKEQNGVCKICGGVNKNGKISIDHDHKTGKVRGLLCRNCNSALGFMKDNPEILAKAIQYLTIKPC